MATHLIGLMLGTEDDWPTAFESLVERAALEIESGGETHRFRTRRCTIEPFGLGSRPAERLVIDRLGWWYHMPREWLKKIAMMDEVYLLNDPFTFQSMEKHTAYCAMLRLGLDIPETWMLPHKIGPDNERYFGTAQRYNRMFDIEEIGGQVGYPLYMKPFDGGGWVGVTRIASAEALHAAYDASGQRLMHVQAGVEAYDVFARSLSIGPQTRVMRYVPEHPLHDRYQLDLELDDDMRERIAAIGRIVNAFFRWELNSCETIMKDGHVHPIDFANACPDLSLISLHAHFPWALTALLRWCVFCCATGRRMAIDMDKRAYFAVADRDDLDDETKMATFAKLADDYFERDRFEDFCTEHLGSVDEIAQEYFAGTAFDELLVRTVRETFPETEHDEMIDRYRGLVAGAAVS